MRPPVLTLIAFMAGAVGCAEGNAMVSEGPPPPRAVSVPLDTLRAEIARGVAPAEGRVGVAVALLEGDDVEAVVLSGDGWFPMQSVFKLPSA